MKKQIHYNKPQKRVALYSPSSSYNVWSRGTGKSVVIADIIRKIVNTMPRSSWVIVGQTYKQILTRTLPSTLNGLQNKLGYRLDHDFFVKRKPPAKLRFAQAYEPPIDYDHYISFRNGTGFHLASLDAGGGSTRGLNVDGIIGDEGLLINKEKYDQEVKATNRGNRCYFKHIPWHHGEFIFSSMPYNNQADWLLAKGDYYKNDGFDFTEIRNQIIHLELEFIKNKNLDYRLELWNKIVELKKQLRFYKNQEGHLYTEADIFDNIQNVGIKFIEEQYRDLTDFIFMTEILNKRIQGIEGGFYPDLSRSRHGYRNKFDNSYLSSMDWNDDRLKFEDCRMDEDLIKTQPLRIAVDWGDKINCISIAQHLKSINEYRFLKCLYVKHPKILDDLAKTFCEYYRFHIDKTVYFAYDHTGNSGVANSNLTYADQFAKILTQNGWTVHKVSKGAAPTHQFKYLLWSRLLREGNPQMPKIRFNLDNCHELFVSMEQAPAKEGRNGIEKDKSSERSSIPQEQATHLSDTADIHIHHMFSHVLEGISSIAGMGAHY